MDLQEIQQVLGWIKAAFDMGLASYALYLAWRTHKELDDIDTELKLMLNQIRFFGYLILAVVVVGW